MVGEGDKKKEGMEDRVAMGWNLKNRLQKDPVGDQYVGHDEGCGAPLHPAVLRRERQARDAGLPGGDHEELRRGSRAEGGGGGGGGGDSPGPGSTRAAGIRVHLPSKYQADV